MVLQIYFLNYKAYNLFKMPISLIEKKREKKRKNNQ